jgi:hypothetical protein
MYAKPLSLIFENQEVTIEVGSSIKKEDLYGKKSTAIEKDNVVLEKVLVTPQGDIIEASTTRSVKVDQFGSLVEDTLVCSSETNQPVFYHSSFKEARQLEKAEPQDAVTLCTESVYPIAQHSLEEGIYRTKFTYRDGAKLQDAIILVNAQSPSFMLVGETRQPPLIGSTETYEFFDADDEESANSDELNFEMF